jgi:hypothetical protein
MAQGKHAWGRCQRSGDRISYRRLVSDGETPGLLVSPEWRDIKHPQESPVRATDDTHLDHPSPDLDVEASPAGQADKLVDALFPGENVFGGGT